MWLQPASRRVTRQPGTQPRPSRKTTTTHIERQPQRNAAGVRDMTTQSVAPQSAIQTMTTRPPATQEAATPTVARQPDGLGKRVGQIAEITVLLPVKPGGA